MKRVQGGKDAKVLECINQRLQKWLVRWDILPYDEGGVTYYEQIVLHKPTIDEVKDIVLRGYNQVVDQKILSGFAWNGMSVWLSSENQFNYKAAYDLAVQTQGMNLPVTFKFGTTEKPEYYTFYGVEELASFYMEAMGYINQTLNEGWKAKDAIDWSEYESFLQEKDETEL